MHTLAIAVGFALFTFFLAALGIRLAMGRVKADKPTFLGAVGLLLVLWVIALPFAAVAALPAKALPSDPEILLVVALGLALLQLVVNWLAIGWIVQVSFGKAILVWFGAMLGGAVALVVYYVALKPFVYETFVVPTNNMAPTVVGWHEAGTCPHCAGPLMIPVHLPDAEFTRYHREDIGVCEKCWKTGGDALPPRFDSKVLSPDRVMANKLLAPRRWDLVVYRLPKHPKVKYLMRLVALPGETVVIKHGAVWIDGEKQTPPDEIASLEYSADRDGRPLAFMTEESPMKLGAGECCVLGDFPHHSADSRHTGPVPWENIDGVLGLRYWPPARLRLWR